MFVVAVLCGLAREGEFSSVRVPVPADRIESADKLIVAAAKDAIDRISNL